MIPSFFNDDWLLCDGTAKCVVGPGTTTIEVRDLAMAGVPEGDSFLKISSGSPTRIVGFGAFSDHGTTDPFRFTIYFNVFNLADQSTTHYFGTVSSHTQPKDTMLKGKKRTILKDGSIKALADDDWTANRPTA